jgi:hypothetical protein
LAILANTIWAESLAILAEDFGDHLGISRFAKANLAGFTFVKP